MKLFFVTMLILLSSQLSQAAAFDDLKSLNQPQRLENKSTQAQSHKRSERRHFKQKKPSGHRGHYGNQTRHNRDYYNRGSRHHYHGNNYCEQDHYNSRHNNGHNNGHNNSHYNSHYNDRNDKHYNNAVWREVTEFRTKNRRARDRHIPINRKIAALELEAIKRSTYIHKAYIEYRNGNTRRIRSLEGHINRGDPLIYHFRDQRHVVALHLEVSPGGHKRGYVRVNAKNFH